MFDLVRLRVFWLVGRDAQNGIVRNQFLFPFECVRAVTARHDVYRILPHVVTYTLAGFPALEAWNQLSHCTIVSKAAISRGRIILRRTPRPDKRGYRKMAHSAKWGHIGRD